MSHPSLFKMLPKAPKMSSPKLKNDDFGAEFPDDLHDFLGDLVGIGESEAAFREGRQRVALRQAGINIAEPFVFHTECRNGCGHFFGPDGLKQGIPGLHAPDARVRAPSGQQRHPPHQVARAVLHPSGQGQVGDGRHQLEL